MGPTKIVIDEIKYSHVKASHFVGFCLRLPPASARTATKRTPEKNRTSQIKNFYLKLSAN